MTANDLFKVFTVSSYRNLHAVKLFHLELRLMPGVTVIDWTQFAPRLSMPLDDRRRKMDVGETCLISEFCEKACATADLVVYYGESGKDSAVLVGMAKAIGIPILGLPGPLEKEGLILRHAVSLWVESPLQALRRIKTVARCHLHDDRELPCTKCRSERICALAGTKIS
ncbi:MAG: hypothetical protein AB7U63_10980 [Porticoccaceae bacterium]